MIITRYDEMKELVLKQKLRVQFKMSTWKNSSISLEERLLISRREFLSHKICCSSPQNRYTRVPIEHDHKIESEEFFIIKDSISDGRKTYFITREIILVVLLV